MIGYESEQMKLQKEMLKCLELLNQRQDATLQKLDRYVEQRLQQRRGGIRQSPPARSATIIPFVPRKMDKA